MMIKKHSSLRKNHSTLTTHKLLANWW